MSHAVPVLSFSDYLTVSEAAALLGISPWTLRNWDKSGKLKSNRHPMSGYRIYQREELNSLLQSESLLSKRSHSLTPDFDWSEIGDSEHFVQFYEREAFLIESVCGYIRRAIADSNAAVVIATRAHRARFQRKLKRWGLDVRGLRASGQYVALDAAETLSKFMIDDRPEPARFQQSVGEVISRLVVSWPRVRAFGEMVALLWAAGNREGACALEEMWNDLGQRYPFSLYCAYPLKGFGDEADGDSLHDLCKSHSRVIPAESYSVLSTPAEQLSTIAILQHKAQRLQAAIAQRKTAERELADFLDNVLEGLNKVGPDGIILWANKAELDLLGYGPDEYIGHHLAEFHVDHDLIDGLLRRLSRGEEVREQPARLRCKDGSIKHVLIHSNACWENGAFAYSRWFTRDVTEIKRAERDQAMLAAIVESSQDAIVSKTLDGTIRSWNAAAERLFGYGEQEAVGQPITLIIPPERFSEEQEILSRLRRGERIEHYETVRVAKDGRQIDISLTISPLRDSTGNIIGASKIARDITERKRVEAALRASEERYRRLAEMLPVAVYTCEAPTGRITYYNDQAAKLWGRTPSLGESEDRFCGSYRMFLPDGRALPHGECPMAQALCDGHTFRNQELVLERPDGSRITVLVNIAPIRDADGRVAGAINVFHDMSALKQAEQLLREQKENVQTLLDTLPVGVLIAHDRQCSRITGNRAAAELLRMPPNGNLSKPAPDDERPGHFRILKQGQLLPLDKLPVQRAARGEVVRSEELLHEFDDGTVIHTLISAQALYDAAGQPRGAVAGILDISERKKAETALREADRRKDEFLATLAHELRNPLAPIRNSLHVLRLSDHDNTREPIYELMERQVAHMVRLIDDLLELSRISLGKIELKRERMDLAVALNHALETSRPLIDAGAHSLEVSLPETPILIEGDLVRLAQIFANLLNNAAKYTDDGGTIRLTTRLEQGEVVVSVRDTGIGIPSDKLSQVFDMFAQIDNPHGRTQEGLGIGLSLVQSLVQMHGGRVEAHSDGLGHGSEFLVHLPTIGCEPDERESAPAAAREVRDARRDHRILVVDDNKDSANTLATMLRIIGADAQTAYDGPSALEAVASARPSMIILDLGMPGMDGCEVARRIRQDPQNRQLVLIAMTGWGQDEDRRRTREAGFDHHLVKPVELSALRQLLGSVGVAVQSLPKSREDRYTRQL